MTFISTRKVGIVASLVSLQEFMMRRFLLTILLTLVVSPAWALTPYYVDPDWGGSQTGAPATPWTSLTSSAWSTINTTLASDDVTVYFSARNASSDTNQASTTPIEIKRTDKGTHRLTLDGISQYNTNDGAPAWTSYITPSPSNYRTASKFQIMGTTPIQSSGLASNTNCLSNITVRGFRAIYTGGGGQIMNLSYIGDLIVEYNEGSKVADGGLGGPGLFVGPVHGPSCAVDNITVQYNYIHDTYGECIYVGTGNGTGDPPGVGGTFANGDNYLIQDNTITDCNRSAPRASPSNTIGQGDGIDVKDGHTNLRIVNNVLTWPHLAAGGNYDTGAACDCSGIIVEAAQLIDGNYVEGPQKDGIYGGVGYANTVGRSTGLIVSNNIVIKTPKGPGHEYPIEFEGGLSSTYQWSGVKFYNNTIYTTGISWDCLNLGSPQTAAIVENNIFHSCTGNGLVASAGVLSTHDYNHYFNITGSALVNGTSTACASIATVEMHSLCANPQFVNTSAPYANVNFRLQAGSLAIGAGLDLSSTFTNDYAGLRRVVPWDVGAFAQAVSGSVPPPPAPTGLYVR